MKKLFGLLFVLSAVPAFAQAPNSPVTYVFTNLPLWDVSGTYTNQIITNVFVDVEIVHQFPDGTLHGSRFALLDGDVDHNLQCIGPTFGKVTSTPTGVKLRSKWCATLAGAVSAIPIRGEVILLDETGIDPLSLSIVEVNSKAHTHFNVPGFGLGFVSSPPIPLPEGMNGDWTLDIDIVAEGNRLEGYGTITLSSGRELDYEVTGIYDPQSQSSKLKFVADRNAAGSSLSLTIQGPEMSLTHLRGRILGQKLGFPLKGDL